MADAASTFAHSNVDPEWIVAVSGRELANGELTPDNDGLARAAMQLHGCVLFRGAFAPATIDAMHREYLAQFGTLDLAGMQDRAAKPAPTRFMEVGGSRYEVVLPMTGAFGEPQVFANALLIRFLAPVLGRDLHLNSFTAVISHPGAPQQRVHRDYPHLFFEPGVGPSLLAHAVNVVVPLIDVDMATGPTGVWLGSHRVQDLAVDPRAITVCPLRRGDCIVLDYRTLHAGLPNRGSRARPIVYMVYARPWFFDHANHVNRRRIPVDMPLARYDELPDSVRPIVARAPYYRMLARWDEADAPASAAERAPQAP
jgi:Phytanoyl-CoA dioxygenase (PhyH)